MTAHKLERGVQRTDEYLYPFFKQRAPRQILKWMPCFLRHPRLRRLVWRALHRRVAILKE